MEMEGRGTNVKGLKARRVGRQGGVEEWRRREGAIG